MCIVAEIQKHTHYSYSLEVHCTIVKCVKHRSILLHKPISVGFISGLIDMKSTGARAGDVFTSDEYVRILHSFDMITQGRNARQSLEVLMHNTMTWSL